MERFYIVINAIIKKNNGSGEARKKMGLDYEGYCDSPQVSEWKLELMGTVLFSKIIHDDDIVEFNEKKHFLKKIKQKDPIIMDIYI